MGEKSSSFLFSFGFVPCARFDILRRRGGRPKGDADGEAAAPLRGVLRNAPDAHDVRRHLVSPLWAGHPPCVGWCVTVPYHTRVVKMHTPWEEYQTRLSFPKTWRGTHTTKNLALGISIIDDSRCIYVSASVGGVFASPVVEKPRY